MNTTNTETKQVNVCRFLAEALSEQFDTFTEDCDIDPGLIEGVVQTELIDFDAMLEHLNDNFQENSDSVKAIEEFKEAINGEVEVFAYWGS
jgi:frataxin-like iron-binding protein CyaY